MSLVSTLLIAAMMAQATPTPKAALPRPSGDPMAIDLDTDPIIATERETATDEIFQSLMTDPSFEPFGSFYATGRHFNPIT